MLLYCNAIQFILHQISKIIFLEQIFSKLEFLMTAVKYLLFSTLAYLHAHYFEIKTSDYIKNYSSCLQ